MEQQANKQFVVTGTSLTSESINTQGALDTHSYLSNSNEALLASTSLSNCDEAHAQKAVFPTINSLSSNPFEIEV